jgi:hypothetical protein
VRRVSELFTGELIIIELVGDDAGAVHVRGKSMQSTCVETKSA